MSFTNANHFIINHLTQVDKSRGGKENGFYLLQNHACHGASHKSAERFDPPKCHPETRIAVINDIMSWASSINPDQRILWLHGAAGAGKSAIAQTLAERCHKEKTLVSSFFFSRTATTTGRDDGSRLIPTLAYQMAIAIPATKYFIAETLEEDPATFMYSLDEQMSKLIAEPLAKAASKLGSSATYAELIIIDGLDECRDAKVQVSIIYAIARAVSTFHVPLRFVITSRPELEIRKAFNSQELVNLCSRLVLDESYKPDKDIELYTRSEFNTMKREHTLSSLLNKDSDWPDESAVRNIVIKSSGQFIYASTVMKYIKDDRGNPKVRLKDIVHISASSRSQNESPYAQLDALYTHILTHCQQDYAFVKPIFEALLFCRDYLNVPAPIKSILAIGDFLCANDIELMVSDLHSILYIPEDGSQQFIKFYHASFSDFLTDSYRSGRFFIDENHSNRRIAELCLLRICNGYLEYTTSNALLYACISFFKCLKIAGFPHDLLLLFRQSGPPEIIETLSRHLAHSNFWLGPVLEQIFSLDFKARLDSRFIMPPINVHIKDICSLMQEKADELAFSNFATKAQGIHSGRAYFTCISSIIRVRRMKHQTVSSFPEYRPHISQSIELWQAMMLESPVQGKEYFLSKTTSPGVFRIIWEEEKASISFIRRYFRFDRWLVPLDDHSYRSIIRYTKEHLWLPAVLHYLLRRSEISRPFAEFLRSIFPDLENYLTQVLLNVAQKAEGLSSMLASSFRGDVSDLLKFMQVYDPSVKYSIPRLAHKRRRYAIMSRELDISSPESSDSAETHEDDNAPGHRKARKFVLLSRIDEHQVPDELDSSDCLDTLLEESSKGTHADENERRNQDAKEKHPRSLWPLKLKFRERKPSGDKKKRK